MTRFGERYLRIANEREPPQLDVTFRPGRGLLGRIPGHLGRQLSSPASSLFRGRMPGRKLRLLPTSTDGRAR